MNKRTHPFLFSLALIIGGLSSVPTYGSSLAELRASMIALYSNMTESEVLARLTSTGVGACYVSDARNVTGPLCNFYFVTGFQSLGNYYGAPIYNTDNSIASGYAGSATASRMSALNTRASTGCFAGVGGLKSANNPSLQWAGNNVDETLLSPEAYAKRMLLRMLADNSTPYDPCNLYKVVAETDAYASAQSAEEYVQSSAYSFRFDNSAGYINPKKCKKVVSTGVSSSSAIPSGFISPTACHVIYKRLLAQGRQISTYGSTNAVTLSSNSPLYRERLMGLRRTALVAYAAAHPQALNPDALETCDQVAKTCSATGTVPTIDRLMPLTQSQLDGISSLNSTH